jgi:hypothetical protein
MTPTFPYWREGLTLFWHATRGSAKMGHTREKETARFTPKGHSIIIFVLVLAFLLQGTEAAAPGGDYLSKVRDTAQIKILDCFLAYQ